MRFYCFFLLFFALPVITFAQGDSLPQPELRGFNAPVTELIESRVEALRMNGDDVESHWNVNALIHHVGNDALQDSITTVDAYRAMMEPVVQQFEDKLDLLCPQNIKMVFNLYSTLGGFDSRGDNGQLPNEKIATLALAQQEFIDYWGVLAERFASNPNVDCIAGLNLKNEPQFNSVTDGLRHWEDLAPLAVAAIREHMPNVRVIVPSEGADPKKLKRLPDSIANDTNNCYGIHAYPFLKYQHSGIGNDPTTTPAPSSKNIKNKFWKSLGAFQHRQQNRRKKGLITNIPPICITEWAVSRSAKDAEVFIDRLVSSFENENNDAGRGSDVKDGKVRRCLRKGEKKSAPWKRCRNKIRNDAAARNVHVLMWFNHAIYEARIWDPRYQPGEEDSFVELPEKTARGAALHRALQYNLTE